MENIDEDSSSRMGVDVHQPWTDAYFNRTKEIVAKYGDVAVTYAIFMRRPVISAPRLAVDWLQAKAVERGVSFDIEFGVEEGRWSGAGEPLMFVTGSFYHLVDLETLLLQKLGAACIAADNACSMCMELPHVRFVAVLRGLKGR